MSNASGKERSALSYAQYSYLLTLYALFIGLLYLWGFWPQFGINILEYASLTDLVKSAAFPIASTFIFLAIGAAIGETITGDEPLSAKQIAFFERLRPYAQLIVATYLLGTAAIWALGSVYKWRFVLPLLITIPIYLTCKRIGMLQDAVDNERIRSLILFCLIILPTYSYGRGLIAAHEITEAKPGIFIADLRDQEVGSNATSSLRLLGHVSDFFFFFDPSTSATVVMRAEEAKVLRLRKLVHQVQIDSAPKSTPAAAPEPASASASR
jgi:hypothetical protein